MSRDTPLFPKPDAPAKPNLSKALERHRAWRGTYTNYKPVNRVACDECVNVLHEAKGVGEPPLSARHTRKSGGGTLRLCAPHNEAWRAIDKVGQKL